MIFRLFLLLLIFCSNIFAHDCLPAAFNLLSISVGHPISREEWAKLCNTDEHGTNLSNGIRVWDKQIPDHKFILVYKGHRVSWGIFGKPVHSDREIQFSSETEPIYLWVGVRYGGEHAAVMRFVKDENYIYLTSGALRNGGFIEKVILSDQFLNEDTFFVFEVSR